MNDMCSIITCGAEAGRFLAVSVEEGQSRIVDSSSVSLRAGSQ